MLQHLKYILQTSIGSVFNILISIVRTKVIALSIGAYGVGILGQLASFTRIIEIIIELGMTSGVINEVSLARAKEDKATIEAFRNTFIVLTFSASLVLGVLTYIFAGTISHILFGAATETIIYIQVLSLFVIFSGISMAYNAFMAANKLVKAQMYKNIAGALIGGSITIGLVLAFGVIGAVVSIVINGLVVILLGAYFCRKHNIPLYLNKLKMSNLKKKRRRSFFDMVLLQLQVV